MTREGPSLGDIYELTRDTPIPDIWFADTYDIRSLAMGVYVKGVRFRVTAPAIRISPFLRERIADGSLRLVTAWDRLGGLDEG
jgi:hypothetical protein